MRSTRPLTHLLNVCLGIFGFSYCMKTVFTQNNWGMQIIAQIQVKVFFLFSFYKHYHMLHIIFQMHCQNHYGLVGGAFIDASLIRIMLLMMLELK